MSENQANSDRNGSFDRNSAGRDGSGARRQLGLCLCGGGITGAMYEVGCLAALEDAFEGFVASDFDVFVGASSGATVAAALAGGLNAQRLYRALLDPADDFFPLQRHHLMRFDLREFRRVWASSLGAIRRLLTSATANPLSFDVWTELDRFYDSLPAGVFSIDSYERFFAGFMARRGIPKSFAQMPRRLAIAAVDLDAGRPAHFGLGDLKHVPVAQAVAASSAIPVLYAPVRIGDRDYVAGGLGEAGHVNLPVELGCDTVIVLNAMVPVHNQPEAREVPTGHGPKKRIRSKGMLWVYNQCWRQMSEARMRQGLEKYRLQRPDVDIVLLEPSQDDATMFLYSPTNFTARRVILEHAYTSTMNQLRSEDSHLRRVLEACGLVPTSALRRMGTSDLPRVEPA